MPHIAYGTPRRLPKPGELRGRVAVLDIAFAAGSRNISYERITRPFIEGLGARLAVWIDHHDHAMQALYRQDARFILRTKAENQACPELVTPQRVEAAGTVDTVLCHVDFDGLCSAAKWLRRGVEPYPGADQDARVIDTRIGKPGERAEVIDRALRARPRDDAIKSLAVSYLTDGARDEAQYRELREAAEELRPKEAISIELARGYQVRDGVAVVGVTRSQQSYDKTALLLAGQELAPISVVHDGTTVTVAARFDSGIDLVKKLDLEGGMPTVVSLPIKFLNQVLTKLRG